MIRVLFRSNASRIPPNRLKWMACLIPCSYSPRRKPPVLAASGGFAVIQSFSWFATDGTSLLGRCARASCVPGPTILYHKSVVGQVRAGFLRSLSNNTVSQEFCWAGARGLPAFPAQQHCIRRALLGRCARVSCVPCPTSLYYNSFGGQVRQTARPPE